MKWDGVPGFWTTVGDADTELPRLGDGYDLRERLNAQRRPAPVPLE